MTGNSIGIDVGGTSVKAAGLEGDKICWTAASQPYSRPSTAQLIDAIREACAPAKDAIGRIGLCVPGLLDAGGQRVTYSANVPGLIGISLNELLAGGLDRVAPSPVIVNDVNAAAYDIYCTRKLRGRLLVLAIGAGVGAAVLDDGQPLFVDGQSPGHIGQIDVSIAGCDVIGPDGGRGGLEGYLSATALTARYGNDAASKIRAGDPPFLALVRAMRICHAIYRPQHICLAGGTGIRIGHLVDALRSAVDADLTSVARRDWTLSLADSDFHAACGAARIAAKA